MFGISSMELAIILIFGFLLFGPDKLPQMGRTIGRALRQFRETQEKMTSVVQSEVIDPMAAVAQAPTASKRAAAVDDDSDIESTGGAAAAPRRKETFAERRARLAAEKAAAEQEAGPIVEGDAEPAEPEPATVAASGEPAVESESAPAEPTTADLYARRPRKKAVPAGDDAAEKGGER